MAKLRKMLSDPDAPYIQSLMKLIETQSKTTLVNWAVDYSYQSLLPIWEKHYPNDSRPQNALYSARCWLAGAIKLPAAKEAILDCHAAARDCPNPAAQAAARAIAQSASSIHSARHCIGLAFYGALAIAYDKLGESAPWSQIESAAGEECAKMEAALISVAVADEPNPAKINWYC
ncbi:MAG: putative immunity protein [Christensenellales bacterium]|jgi:hypothetical protein